MVTDQIESFTETGIQLQSGKHLEADIIITATGLKLINVGGMELIIDGKVIDPASTVTYKGMMFSDIPNMAQAFGYTNASWTLKCDLTSKFVSRLLNHMKKKGLCLLRPLVKMIPIWNCCPLWISTPATSCDTSTTCPGKAPDFPGNSSRTTLQIGR